VGPRKVTFIDTEGEWRLPRVAGEGNEELVFEWEQFQFGIMKIS
jgi:hypothetical protein